MKNMKKMLSALGLLAVAAPASLSVVACGPVDTDPKEEALNNLSVTIDKAVEFSSSTELEFADKIDLSVEIAKANLILKKEDASIEKINASKSQLEWQVNKFADKYTEGASENLKELSRHLAWATEIFNLGVDISEVKGKEAFADAIEVGIEVYNSKDEEKFEAAISDLADATSTFISDNDISE